ncbi:MAG: beta-lactamase family protein [Sciscionella sp.]|nr:beta-lactamase family protein [Sciscionella sp.]
MATPAMLAGCGGQAGAGSAHSTDRPRSSPNWPEFDDYLRRLAEAGQFSGAVLVAKNGKPVLQRAYGMADKTRRMANTPRTTFNICSMGKMFTAVAIAQLVGEHKLSFTDRVGQYLTAFPAAIADDVTIHQLLTHTSGMDDVALRRTPNSTPPTTLDGQLSKIAAAPLRFPPGSRMSYSNDGFIVLGAIVEKVSGLRYRDYLRRNVFGRAGMPNTDVAVYTPSRITGMAHGYMLVGRDGQPVQPRPGRMRACNRKACGTTATPRRSATRPGAGTPRSATCSLSRSR